ncbi:hypothetical protein OFO11_41775, partial [Escherichia coli]|nr:hypothetical protein [Escherichia coli]
EAAQAVMGADGVALDAQRQPIASADLVVGLRSGYRNGEQGGFIELRGIGPQSFALRPEINLVAGRSFEPALHELIVGT